MKVIVAGMFKTGTKSMVAALKELDYDVYDYLDHFWYHGNEWIKILTHGGSQYDFKRMYEDVDAIADSPVYLFWEEISQVFPDCKVKNKLMSNIKRSFIKLKRNHFMFR